MFEINLSPGAERKRASGGGGFSLKLPQAPDFDRMMAFVVAAWIIAPLAIGWMFFSVRGNMADTQAALDQAVADSARYAAIIETQASLRARQDTIAQKLTMIQDIDAGRYIWPHILDEVSRALPPFTWLEAIDQVSGGVTPRFQVEGRTGSLPALTRFMDALEASPFLRNVELVTSERAQIGNDPNRVVNDFVLTGTYEAPPIDVLETVPLFEDAAADTTIAREENDGTGTS
jgi:Tfp pilus assembly protein PilN